MFNKILMILAMVSLVLMPVAGLAGCSSTGDPLDDVMIVLPDDLNEEAIVDPFNPEQNVLVMSLAEMKEKGILPSWIEDSVVQVWPNYVGDLAIAERRYVNETVAKWIPLTVPNLVDPETGEPAGRDWLGWIGGLLGSLGGVIGTSGAAPYLAPLAFLLNSFRRKRSRQHLASTVRALNPLSGGNIALGEAWTSANRAMGWDHSSEEPVELRRVADKIEAENELKARVEAEKLVAAVTTATNGS
jgi:hypothetical protein